MGANKSLQDEYDEKEALCDVHGRRLQEAMTYLGVPSLYEIKYEQAQPSRICGHVAHAADNILPFINMRKYDTANHVARVTLDSIAVADFLGMHQPQYQHARETLVASAYRHDSGKIFFDFLSLMEKQSGFTKEDAETMKEHVSYSTILERDKDIGRVIGHHHNWQENPYADDQNGEFSLTPLTEVLSKFLGIIDFHDSASTRINTRFSRIPRNSTKDEVIKFINRVYGNLSLDYEGDELPPMNIEGSVLIDALYQAGIFGRKDSLNPYPRAYSFIKRSNFMKTFVERTKTRMRALKIKRKNKQYASID